jgi:response regulator RpfG family c-di-GMP phosphodiesterase
MQAHECPRSAESKFRILYLGTDLKLIAALRQVLTEPDYQLVAGADHGGAILFLRSEIPYDLLLIDFEWRGKEGLELAQLAHSLTSRKRMPIILVSPTELSSRLKKSAREASVSKCVTKTPDAEVVSQTIRQLSEC